MSVKVTAQTRDLSAYVQRYTAYKATTAESVATVILRRQTDRRTGSSITFVSITEQSPRNRRARAEMVRRDGALQWTLVSRGVSPIDGESRTISSAIADMIHTLGWF